mmetsp:Transcript_8776/g.19284  ORF Transcript_8776/g.19284 Transcript_8776/m.19284 type:complete len:272 (+) Transcript_8776:54-869(+)
MHGRISSINPTNSMAVDPLTLSRSALAVDVAAHAVLLAILPVPYVRPSVGPQEAAFAGLAVGLEVALVDPTIGPSHLAIPIHLTGFPHASVDSAICEDVRSDTFHGIVHKLAVERGAIGGGKIAIAMLLPSSILATELRPVTPSLVALPPFHILVPLPVVRRTIGVPKPTTSVGLVGRPLALVRVAISVRKPPYTPGTIFLKLPLVSATVGPQDHAPAVPSLSKPLPGVGGAALQLDGSPRLQALVFAVRHALGHLEPHRLLLRGAHLLDV